MKAIKYILALILLLQSCNFEDLVFSKDDDSNNDPEHVVVKTYKYDSEKDILSYLEDDVVQWREYYDFEEVNGEMKPTYVKRILSSDIIYEHRRYRWESGNPVLVAYYDLNGNLTYFDTFKYNNDNRAILRASYNSSSELDSIDTVEYSDDGSKQLNNKNYNGNGEIQLAKEQKFNSNDEVISKFYYKVEDNNFALKSYFYYDREFEYYQGYTAYKTEAYGTGAGVYLSGLGTWINGNVQYGGINTTSRNTENITTPEQPTYPNDPETELLFENLNFKWMTLEVEDNYGKTFTSLNSNYMPTQIRRSAPDYFEGYMYIDIVYDNDDRVISKTTRYEDKIILKLTLEYNEETGNPTSLTTIGAVMLLPMTYQLTYNETKSNIPDGISIYSGDAKLQTLKYVYKGDIDITKLKVQDIDTAILRIEQYDGDDKHLSNYVFDYSDENKELTLNVQVPTEETPESFPQTHTDNGKIVIGYNTDSTTAYLKSFDKEDKIVWDYNYSYADFDYTEIIDGEEIINTAQTRLTELKNEYEDDVTNTLEQVPVPQTPQSITGIDIESLFLDIKNLIPIDIEMSFENL